VALLATLALSAAGCGDDTQARVPVEDETSCDWPMLGRTIDRSFRAECPSRISAGTVADLELQWFHAMPDVVSATPVVHDGTVYVGDWSGTFRAIDALTGEARWSIEVEPHPPVYAGQITASATVAAGPLRTTVVFASGHTVHAVNAATGSVVWRTPLGSGPTDPTEIEAAPVVADGLVVVPFDVHNNPGHRGGVTALDLETGERRWTFDPEEGREPVGCGDVWGSPAVDLERRLVFAGSANCPPSPRGWGRFTEALFALELDTGEPVWSFQPHEPNNDDLDFAGAPNLFTIGTGEDARDVVGLGNKDGTYYVVDRETGEPVWSAEATGPGISRPGSNFSYGGFIGPLAVAPDAGVVVGGTAVGPDPYLHGIDLATGAIRWQQPAVGPTYGGSAAVNDLVFVGGTDFTLWAVEAATGEIRWQAPMSGVVAGTPAIVGDEVYAVAGFKEPGTPARVETSGVYKFGFGAPATPPSVPVATAEGDEGGGGGAVLVDDGQRCVGEPCDVRFELKTPPEPSAPTLTMTIEPSPFRLTVEATGLGEPSAWIRDGSLAAGTGATAFALFISESDDDPNGGLLCVLDEDGRCTATTVPRPGRSYNRISLLAVADPGTVPGPQEGFDRLVTTIAFDPPLRTEPTED
jgi:polyvinyl alcohol dehydrogenase (cytochrome)